MRFIALKEHSVLNYDHPTSLLLSLLVVVFSLFPTSFAWILALVCGCRCRCRPPAHPHSRAALSTQRTTQAYSTQHAGTPRSASHECTVRTRTAIMSAAPADAAASASTSLTLSRPMDDLHLHLRDGEVLVDLLRHLLVRPSIPFAPAPVARAIVMPNLQPPVTTAQRAADYRGRIMQALDEVEKQRQEEYAKSDERTAGAHLAPLSFTPLMTLYLTDHTSPQDIRDAHATGFVYACKLYPKGATTHSNEGVTDILALVPTLRCMAEVGMLLLIHGESTDPSVDIFDREEAFLSTLARLIEAVPTLRIVLEHATTAAGVAFVRKHSAAGVSIAATLTPQHLLLNRNALFEGGLNPAVYCLPILKPETDRRALMDAIMEGADGLDADKLPPFLFAGTDSAPHARANKEKSCGCAAGCFTAHASIELYAEAFEAAARERNIPAAVWQRRLESFLCSNGATFYKQPLNEAASIRVEKKAWSVPSTLVSADKSTTLENSLLCIHRKSHHLSLCVLVCCCASHMQPFGSSSLIPMRAGNTIAWSLAKPQ